MKNLCYNNRCTSLWKKTAKNQAEVIKLNKMSGIAGVYQVKDGKQVEKMLDKLKHRGPEVQKVFDFKKVSLGNTALKEEAGGYFKKDGTTIVVDGAVYNENRASPEVILDSFFELGTESFNELDGCFTFIISDGEDIIAARDPVGLKPLYYVEGEDCIYFASEIKALVHTSSEIKPFPPGHYYHFQKGFVKYYQMPEMSEEEKVELNEAIQKVHDLLVNAADKRYREGKKLGVYLSGGIDSSVVAAAAAEVSDNLETFSVGVKHSNDVPKARKVANYLGSTHHEYIYDEEEMLEILPEVIYHLESFDMYLVRSSIANYLVSKLAKEAGVDLVFCGEGGDELFGGYHYLKQFGPDKIKQELLKLTFTGHRNGFQRVDRMTAAHSLDCHMPFMDKDVSEYAFKLPVAWKIKDKTEKWILRKAFEKKLPEDIVWRKKQKFFKGAGCDKILEKIAEDKTTDEEFEKEKQIHEDFILRSKEELFYYKIFRKFFPTESVLSTIGRTATVIG